VVRNENKQIGKGRQKLFQTKEDYVLNIKLYLFSHLFSQVPRVSKRFINRWFIKDVMERCIVTR